MLCISVQQVTAQDSRFQVELELGSSWQEKNRIQIPNDASGTRFSAGDIVGAGPWTHVRLNGLYHINDKHGIRLVLAPFSYDESGVSDVPINFAGESFAGNQPLDLSYQFNSWRIGYQYHFYQQQDLDLWFGVTAKIRDAEIRLEQDGTRAIDDNLGFVPLLYFAAEYRFNDRWSVFADLDGLAGGPGRAFDLSIKLNYRLDEHWQLGLGYRTLEGGVDSDDVYNFAWFNTALLSVSRKF